MAIKTFTTGEVLTASDTNTYLANSGLVYVTSATVGTGVSSVTVSSCFSSTYDSYRIVWQGGALSSACDVNISFGGNTNNHYGFNIYGLYTGATVYGYNYNNAASFFAGGGDSGFATVCGDAHNPNKASGTVWNCQSPSTSTAFCSFSGRVNSAVQSTAFTLTPTAGTMTGGQVIVYGYRKA